MDKQDVLESIVSLKAQFTPDGNVSSEVKISDNCDLFTMVAVAAAVAVDILQAGIEASGHQATRDEYEYLVGEMRSMMDEMLDDQFRQTQEDAEETEAGENTG